MKRITYLALAIILCFAAFGVVGCGDRYVEVQSITYSVGGETTTLTSTFSVIAKNTESINADPKEKAYQPNETINVDKNNIPSLRKEDIVYTYNSNLYNEWVLIKGNFSHIEYNYVYFQKLDEKTIKIKHDGKEFEVMTDSYQVTYFN